MTTAERAPASLTPAELNRLVLSIAAAQDREAFASLYGHFAPRVKSYLVRLGTPPAVAEDLAQDAMLSVWRKAAYFDPSKAGASTWIFTIARNLRIDHARRDRAPANFQPDPVDEPTQPATPDSALMAAERDERIREALTTLSAEQSAIVKLFYLQEKPHSEIAATLGIPLGTVKSRVRLAVGRLRTLLDDLR